MPKIAQDIIEIAFQENAYAKVVQDVIEVAMTRAADPNPATVTGAGVTQYCVEVAVSLATQARVAQDVIEIALALQEEQFIKQPTTSWVAVK